MSNITKSMRMIPSAMGAMGLTLTRNIMGLLPSSPSTCPPIVLMHGFAGFKDISVFGIEILQYWNGIPQLLRQMGYEVYVPTVSPLNPPQVRAQQWYDQLEKYRNKHGNDKFFLIAHSQGAIDARLLLCPDTNTVQTSLGPLNGLDYGEYVDALVTVGGPHFGNVLVDKQASDPKTAKTMKELFDFISFVIYGITGKPQDANQAIAALGQKYMLEEFNPYCVDHPDVDYFCIAGNPKTEKLVSSILEDAFKELNDIPASDGGGPNDGFVTVPSALFGNAPENAQPGYTIPTGTTANTNWKTLGSTIMSDHVTEVGLPLDCPPNKYYDHLTCFAGLAQKLDPDYTANMDLKDNGRWHRS